MITKDTTAIKSMRVYVTENCNANCPNCFNANTRTKKEIEPHLFKKLSEYLSSNGVQNLKILGGEPTVHNNYFEIIKIAQDNFKSITIFTNGVNDNISKTTLRKNDSIVYNFNFCSQLNKEKLLISQECKKSFEIQVTKNSDEKKLVKNLLKLLSIAENNINISLTLDCTSNIFKDKKVLLPKLHFIETELQKYNLKYSYDHKMPFCFLYQSGLHPNNTGSCDLSTASVIDSNLSLRYCLQYPQELINLYQDEKFIPFDILINYLTKYYYELRLKSLNKICLDCTFFNKYCNGGCWIPKDYITREDILENTNFPIM